MSGFNVLLLQSVDKQAEKEPIANRTRAYKKKKVSPIHIVNVKWSNRVRHPQERPRKRRSSCFHKYFTLILPFSIETVRVTFVLILVHIC